MMFIMALQAQGEHGQASKATPETTRASKKRGENFTIEEDKLLISAWLNVSQDVMRDNKQMRKSYWKRVTEYFHNYKDFDSNHRTENSLMNRWSTIQLSVTKFCGCFAEVEGLHQDGVTEYDKVREAKIMYKELNKATFPFEHGWDLLKYEAKWLEKCNNKRQKCKKSVSTSSTTDSVNLGEENVSHASFVDMEISLQRKAEEQRLNKRRTEEHESDKLEAMSVDIQEDKKNSNAQKLEMLEKTFDQEKVRLDQEKERLDHEKKRLRLEEERLRLERQREDERIIMMDTSGLTPPQAAYYQRRIKEILKQDENL